MSNIVFKSCLGVLPHHATAALPLYQKRSEVFVVFSGWPAPWLLTIDKCDVSQVCRPDPSKGGGVITHPTLTFQATPPRHWYTHTHTRTQSALLTGAQGGSCYRCLIERGGRGGEETSIGSLSLSGIEFLVELIVFSKDQDKGIGPVNIVSL